jgi:predicted DNA-binding transcriptional regulator AlpA
MTDCSVTRQDKSVIQPILLSAKEVATLLHVSVRHIWRLRASAKLPGPLKLGGALRWREKDIVEWVSANCPNQDEFLARKESKK